MNILVLKKLCLTMLPLLASGSLFAQNMVQPCAGAGSTLAAAEAIGYASIGIEKDSRYFNIARSAIPKLRALRVT